MHLDIDEHLQIIMFGIFKVLFVNVGWFHMLLGIDFNNIFYFGFDYDHVERERHLQA